MTTAVAGPRGAVASGHPRAAEVGVDALEAGGSCIDAVLAMAFAQWVVSSPLCGPGGDLVILHVEDGRAVTYGGWSRVPVGLPADGPVERYGPRSAVAPGALAGAELAWRAGARLPWHRLFDGAHELASGHEVTPGMAEQYASVVERGHGAALRAVLGVDDPPATGAVVSSTALGLTLRRLADGGAGELHGGGLGDEVAELARQAGAHLSAADLGAVTGAIDPSPATDLGDVSVAVTAPPSQAAITTTILGAVDPVEPPERREFAAVAGLIEEELTKRCVVGVPGTATSVATDGAGAAVVVHSLAGVQYGSGWVAGGTGIALGNRVGTSLSTRPDLPAANPRPGDVLPHTLSAAWLQAGDRSMLVGTPGGDRQVQWLAQAGQRFRQGAPIEQVVEGPRWFVCPVGDRFGVPEGIGAEWFLFAEPGIDWAGDARLHGYEVRVQPSVGGGLQALVHDRHGWSAAADPRAAGAALAAGSGGRAASGGHGGST